MFILICYDIACDRRRNKVANKLEGHGERVQESVFECWLEAPRLAALKTALAAMTDPETDRIRYYPLCRKDRADIAIDGCGTLTADRDCLVVDATPSCIAPCNARHTTTPMS